MHTVLLQQPGLGCKAGCVWCRMQQVTWAPLERGSAYRMQLAASCTD